MQTPFSLRLTTNHLTAFAASLVSALLFSLESRGYSAYAIILVCFAPLPLIIGVLGYSAYAAALGGLAGSGALALFYDPFGGLLFACIIVIPAWLLAMAALQSRKLTVSVNGEKQTIGPLFLSPAALACGAFLLSALAAVTLFSVLVLNYGGYTALSESMTAQLTPILTQMREAFPKGFDTINESAFARLFLTLFPASMSLLLVFLYSVNLWIGARIVLISGRLPRPWPNLAAYFVLPRSIALAFLAAFTIAGTASGLWAALVGAIWGGALMLLAFQGVSVAYDLSARTPARAALMTGVYVFILFFSHIAVVCFGLLGLADSFLFLRDRTHKKNGQSQKRE